MVIDKGIQKCSERNVLQRHSVYQKRTKSEPSRWKENRVYETTRYHDVEALDSHVCVHSYSTRNPQDSTPSGRPLHIEFNHPPLALLVSSALSSALFASILFSYIRQSDGLGDTLFKGPVSRFRYSGS
jgi:hypothetical protein